MLHLVIMNEPAKNASICLITRSSHFYSHPNLVLWCQWEYWIVFCLCAHMDAWAHSICVGWNNRQPKISKSVWSAIELSGIYFDVNMYFGSLICSSIGGVTPTNFSQRYCCMMADLPQTFKSQLLKKMTTRIAYAALPDSPLRKVLKMWQPGTWKPLAWHSVLETHSKLELIDLENKIRVQRCLKTTTTKQKSESGRCSVCLSWMADLK